MGYTERGGGSLALILIVLEKALDRIDRLALEDHHPYLSAT
jgi:hypothetical protein